MEDLSLSNAVLNTEEMLSGKTVLSSRPRRLNVALTTRCNIDCIMCEVKKLDWELPEKVAKEILGHFPYLERIIWQGGEVFLYRTFKDVLKTASHFPRLTNEITTNAHLLNEEWAELLGKIRADINISIDGTTGEIYESIRRKSKFDNIIKNLDLLNRGERNGERTLLVTVMRTNYDQLGDFVEFAAKHRFTRIIFQPVKANHFNDENIFRDGNKETVAYLARQMAVLQKQADGHGIRMKNCLPIPESAGEPAVATPGKDPAPCPEGRKEIFCFAPWQQLFIEWGGNVYPHCLCIQDGNNDHKKVGSVLEEPLGRIWNGEKMAQFRQSMLDDTYHARCSGSCVGGNIPRDMRNILEKAELDRMVEKGKMLIRKEQYGRAADILKNVLHLDPNWASAHFELGKAYYLQQQYDLALETFKTACERRIAGYNTFTMMAKAYKETGRFEQALQELKSALPHFEQAKNELTREYVEIVPSYIEQVRKKNFDAAYAEALNGARDLHAVIPRENAFLQNQLLNEIEIAEKRPVLESKMRNLIVTLSTDCNLRCVMCEWVRAKRWALPVRALGEVRESFPYLERVVWQGGEALAYRGLRDLVEEAAAFPYLRQVITTNGLLVNEEWAERLVRSNVDLTFSVDGVTRDVYEKIRHGADFEVLLKNLKYFNECKQKRKSRINTNLHVVVMRSNYRQLEDYIPFALKYGFNYIAFLPIEGNFNSPENIFHGRDPEAAEYLSAAIERIREKAERHSILIASRLPVAERRVPEAGDDAQPQKKDVTGRGTGEKMLCHLPWIQLYIDYDGSIRPDCTCRREGAVGNADTDSLFEVWNNAKMQEYRKKISAGAGGGICNQQCVRGEVPERYLKFW